ncbi:MAG: HlyD family secretion protein, partial [Tannerella sp.]|nr:HlyD family secretion protein [Tannerella sp.]
SGKELDESKSRQLQGQLTKENMLTTVNSMKIQMAQMQESLIDMKYTHTEKTNDFRSQIRSMVSQIKTEIQSWELNYVLKAPIDGKITFTNYWVINQNVSVGENIFTIIPDNQNEIIGKAQLPVARSGKVEEGQRVNIHLDNFPDTEFGTLRGTVKNISKVPVKEANNVYYTVEIALPDRLKTTYNRELPNLPDLQGHADIVTEDISLLERFVLPIKKIFKESM